MVDSGCEPTLAAPFLARAIGITPDPNREQVIGIGGAPRTVRFADVSLRLGPPGTGPAQGEEWQAEVGFITDWTPPWSVLLGQIGFFDHFTVSMSRYSQGIAIEPFDAFDQRFDVQIRESVERASRFEP
jgi:hypothetical protein